MFRADLRDRLQPADFQGGRVGADDRRRLGQLFRRRHFALRLDDAGALFPDRLGLAGDGALHLLGDVEVFQFDRLDLDTPALHRGAQHLQQAGVDRQAVAQQAVEFALADGVAHPGLGRLLHGVAPVGDRDDGAFRIGGAIPQHGVDLDRDAVAAERLLGVELLRDGAQIDGDLALDKRDQQIKSRPAMALEAAEPEDDGALIFLRHADGHQQQDDDNRGDGSQRAHCGGSL